MITEFCKILGVSEAELLGSSHGWNISRMRQLYWKLLSRNGFTHEEIAQLNDRARSTVTKGIIHIDDLISKDFRVADQWWKVFKIKR